MKLGPGRPSAGGPRMDRRAVTSPGVVKILRLASRLRRSAGRGTYPTAVLIKHLMKKILFNSHYRRKHGILRSIDNMRNERYPMHYDGCMLCPITKPVTWYIFSWVWGLGIGKVSPWKFFSHSGTQCEHTSIWESLFQKRLVDKIVFPIHS